MERFVRAIVAGGVALVAGLWVAAFAAPGSPAWLAGAALALAGAGGLAAGVLSELDVGVGGG